MLTFGLNLVIKWRPQKLYKTEIWRNVFLEVHNFKSENVGLFLLTKVYKIGALQDIFAKPIKSKWQGSIKNTVLVVINAETATGLEIGNLINKQWFITGVFCL